MKKLFALCLLAVAGLLAASAQTATHCENCPDATVYDFSAKNDAGEDVSLAAYKGKVLLIVNTATRCGFTPQYTELETLYEKYRDAGFEILDFPCDQFGHQAPGTIEEIHQFCTANFNIQFPQFDKIDVNGPDAAPLFVWLKQQKGFGGFDQNNPIGRLLHERFSQRDPDYAKNPDIKWNFTKFLVTSEGVVVARFEPTAPIADIDAAVEETLKK